jgi:hypothetical protein
MLMSPGPMEFPAWPIPAELDRGVRLYALGKGLDRLYLEDRKVIGTWFDGRARVGADEAIWLSPGLMSRWLGYLEAKEKWPRGELEARWRRIRADLGGRLTFVVRLCSFPRTDLFEEGLPPRHDPRDSRDVRFLWTSNDPDLPRVLPLEGPLSWVRPEAFGTRVPSQMQRDPRVFLLSERQARSASEAMREDWWLRVPFGETLRPEFSESRCWDGYPLGDFYCSTYLATLPLPRKPMPDSEFELRIFSPRKERIARFDMGEGSRR